MTANIWCLKVALCEITILEAGGIIDDNPDPLKGLVNQSYLERLTLHGDG